MTKGNDFAFSSTVEMTNFNNRSFKCEKGLTKREHFAAMAMQGALSSSVGGAFQAIDYQYFAEHSVKFADALIKSLNENKGE